MNVLVVGGSSGLGLELSEQLIKAGSKVIATGRHTADDTAVDIRKLDLAKPALPKRIDDFVKNLPDIEALYFVAGLYPAGTVTDLTPEQIDATISVGGRALIFFVRSLLEKQGELAKLMVVTSMSQYEPKKSEIIYNFVKAGEGHFANGLAEDGRIAKVMTVAPSGMREPGDKEADDTLLDKAWVSQQIQSEMQGDFRFKAIKLLRKPARVEIAETR